MARNRIINLQVSPAKARLFESEMLRFMEVGDWNPANSFHLVALYIWCHEQVYGIKPLEVQGHEYGVAAHTAKAFLAREFRGDMTDCVSFIRWTWRREAERESWRRNNGKEGKRIGWRLQFGPALLTDYKLFQHRSAMATPA